MKYFDSYDIIVFHHCKQCSSGISSHDIFLNQICLIQMQVPDNTEWIGTVWWWYYKYQDWWRIPDMFRVMYEHMTFLPCFGQSDYSYDYHQQSYRKKLVWVTLLKSCAVACPLRENGAWLANSGITWAELGSWKSMKNWYKKF